MIRVCFLFIVCLGLSYVDVCAKIQIRPSQATKVELRLKETRQLYYDVQNISQNVVSVMIEAKDWAAPSVHWDKWLTLSSDTVNIDAYETKRFYYTVTHPEELEGSVSALLSFFTPKSGIRTVMSFAVHLVSLQNQNIHLLIKDVKFTRDRNGELVASISVYNDGNVVLDIAGEIVLHKKNKKEGVFPIVSNKIYPDSDKLLIVRDINIELLFELQYTVNVRLFAKQRVFNYKKDFIYKKGGF